MGIISENEEAWKRRGDFLDSFLKSEGKTVSMHGKVQFFLLYHRKQEYSEHYKEVMKQMKDKARSEFHFLNVMPLLVFSPCFFA